MKLRLLLTAVMLAFVTPHAAWADLTIRYKIGFQPGPGLPQQAAQSLQTAIKNIPAEVVMQIRDDVARWEIQGQTTLVDYGKRRLTVLDGKTQRFATVELSDVPLRLTMMQALLPPNAAEALRNFKLAVEKKAAGQTGMISGIRAEESAVTLTMTVPVPQTAAGSTPAPAMAPEPLQVRFDVTQWRPLADELMRIPALNEYANWATRARGLVYSAGMLNSIFSALPGLGEQMRNVLKAQPGDERPALRIQITLSIPNLAALAEQSRQAGTAAPEGLDLSGPLLEMNYELSELTAAPLSDALFSIPAGFRSVSMEEMARSAGAVSQPASPAPQPAAPARTLPSFPPGVYRVGGGVTPPRLIDKKAPEYTQEARRDRVEGTVVLRVVVGEDGKPSDVQVSRSLRPDLDQKAIEAVSQWNFEPGTKDGRPVKVAAVIEVNFQLLNRPPASPQQ